MPYIEMETNTATKLILIARIAKEDNAKKFTSLTHLLNAEYLFECFKELKKKKAAGIDGRTLESYRDEEMKNILTQTVIRMKQKKYRPLPVRSVDIVKDNGKTRTLGIPTVVDKVVQMGIAKILQTIYEPNLLDVSFGYRPGKDAHACLKEVNHMIMQKKVNYIIDADISGYFDNIDHTWLIKCLEQRIKDPNFKSLILKFLKAGIIRNGRKLATDKGTPQGGIISPILANIYLHYVFDLWFEKKERKLISGYSKLIRYADDFIVGLQYQHEAKQLLSSIADRIKKFGLKLSLEKTGIIEFGRFAKENQERRGKGKPETFDFLGFTHYCSKTRDGRFMLKVQTSSKKLDKAVLGMQTWLKSIINQKQLQEIWPLLKVKLLGHYNYYGISGNIEGLKQYYGQTKRLLFKWINRRSQKKTWNWETFEKQLSLYPIPQPKLTYEIYHTW